MRLTCGNCNSQHNSLSAVRACYRSFKPKKAITVAPKPAPKEFSRSELFPTATGQVRDGVVAEEGFYRKNQAFYKVQKSPRSGRNFAKILTPSSVRGGKPSWEYARGAVFNLSEKDRVSKKDAREFGELYGRCIRCGRTLTDEGSIEKAMGPVCSAKLFG